MASPTRHESNREPSDNRRYAGASGPPNEGSFQQGANITSGRREDLSRGGGFRRVSPGGEYLSGAPREYPSEAYSDQGFGKKTHARTTWRTEDKIFGPDSIVDEGTPSQQFRGIGPRNYRRSDERIREDACEVLSDDLFLDASTMEVDVKEGEITLNGTTHSREDKRRAEDLVEKVRGVTDVHNRLRVEP